MDEAAGTLNDVSSVGTDELTDSSDEESFALVEELEGSEFVETETFAGYRHGYFFGTRDGLPGYYRDTEHLEHDHLKVPDGVDGARG